MKKPIVTFGKFDYWIDLLGNPPKKLAVLLHIEDHPQLGSPPWVRTSQVEGVIEELVDGHVLPVQIETRNTIYRMRGWEPRQ